ncbi:LamG-like jellyroll fold domain-containing protein, partial [Nonomuraea sp. LPB2021202275-12-8]|uniref:LamG-like jellyroll fold domain-containing protein n=1 Tax=Nonomuraea sp. LPB2021202275-12-8 TaxID=3120159 RepID=UPI00300C1BEB
MLLQPTPVRADLADPASFAVSQGLPETPKQAFGTTKILPPLTSSEETQTDVDPGTPKKDVYPPKNALPQEQRTDLTRQVRTPLRDTGGTSSPSAVALLAADPPCGSVPAWQPNRAVTAGDRVAYQQRIWRARVSTLINITPPPEDPLGWAADGTCPLPPAPKITSLAPDNALQMLTTTPTFSATATTWAGGTISFDFEVCDGPSMNNCTTYDDCCAQSGSVTVPEGELGWGRQYWWRLEVRDASTIGGQGAYSETRSFVVGVRQPTITSQLSTPGIDGQEFHQASGNYTTTFTDAQVAVAGPSLAVVRSYNSMDPRRDGVFGAGWSSRWDMRVVEENIQGRPAVLVTYPDGRQVRFAKNGNGDYQPPPGMFATLAKNADGGWRLMDKSSTSYSFNSAGQLLRVRDQRGRSQELTYGSDGKLAKATAPGGRSLSFTWSGAHIGSVSTDPVDGQALTWTYTYTGDVLEKVCNPAQDCTLYGHNPGSLYRSMVLDSDPMGYWRFGEASGTQAMDLGWIGNAFYRGGQTLGQPGALAGTSDTAVAIPTSAWPVIDLPTGIIPRAGAWGSVETWFKTSASGNIITVDGTGSAALYPLLQVTADGKLAAGYEAPSRITTAASVKDGAWHHAVLTAEGDAQTLYVDGVVAGTFAGAISNTGPHYTEAMGIGGLAGCVDEVAVYDRPLSAAEIARHYAARAEAPHKLTKITLPSGRVWASNTYDGITDRIKTHTDDNGGTWQLGDPAYDRTTGLSTITVTDPASGTLTSVHDAWRGYRLVSQTDQLGKKTAYLYDTGGYVSKITDANNNSVTRSNDSRGNVLATSTCRSAGSCQTAWSEFYLNKNDQFDQRNDRLVKVRDARSADRTSNVYASTFNYNEYGEQTKQTTPATLDFPDGRSVTLVYTDGTEAAVGGGVTPAGLVKTHTDANGNTTLLRHTAAGDLAEQTEPAGLVSTFEYDTLGRKIAQTQVSEAEPSGVRTTYTYDERGWLTTQNAPGVKNQITDVTHTARTSYIYDPDGNLLTETVADLTGGDTERLTSYTYDGFGRQETATDPAGGVVRASWDKFGLQTSLTDELGAVFGYAYTKRGELATRTLKNWTGSPVSPQAATEIVLESLSYDPAGRLSARTDAMGRKTSFSYYDDDLLSKVIADDVKLNGSATAQDVVLESVTYDAAGNLKRELRGGGTT